MDPEIIQEFCLETDSLIEEMLQILEQLESSPTEYKLLETFGQKVDRIMGAAKSLECHKMGTLSELCKTISYKAAQSKNVELVIIVVAFLFEAVEALGEMSSGLKETNQEVLNPVAMTTIQSRLEFMAKKLSNIQRSSVAISDKDLLEMSDTFNRLNKSK